MEKTIRKGAISLSKEAAFILLTVVGAVILPQIFHAAGVVFGVGGTLGQIFLPMYLPVLMIGFYRGAASGAVAGLLAPLVSHAITNMPAAAVLPYITVELVALGLLAGLFSNVKLPALLRVFLVQVLAKIVRLAVLATTLYISTGVVSTQSLFAGILISVPGVVLQLVAVTLLIAKKEKNA